MSRKKPRNKQPPTKRELIEQAFSAPPKTAKDAVRKLKSFSHVPRKSDYEPTATQGLSSNRKQPEVAGPEDKGSKETVAAHWKEDAETSRFEAFQTKMDARQGKSISNLRLDVAKQLADQSQSVTKQLGENKVSLLKWAIALIAGILLAYVASYYALQNAVDYRVSQKLDLVIPGLDLKIGEVQKSTLAAQSQLQVQKSRLEALEKQQAVPPNESRP